MEQTRRIHIWDVSQIELNGQISLSLKILPMHQNLKNLLFLIINDSVAVSNITLSVNEVSLLNLYYYERFLHFLSLL